MRIRLDDALKWGNLTPEQLAQLEAQGAILPPENDPSASAAVVVQDLTNKLREAEDVEARRRREYQDARRAAVAPQAGQELIDLARESRRQYYESQGATQSTREALSKAEQQHFILSQQRQSQAQSPFAQHAAALQSTVAALRQHYQENPQARPDIDIVPRALGHELHQHRASLEKEVAGMTPQERKQVEPEILAMNKEMLAVEKEEIHLRRRLNGELTAAQYAMVNFYTSLAAGDPRSAIGAVAGRFASEGTKSGTVIAIALAAISHMANTARDEQKELSRLREEGGGVLNPARAQTLGVSQQLSAMEEARRSGQDELNAAKIRLEQLRAQAARMGIPESLDPQNPWMGGNLQHPIEGARTVWANVRGYFTNLGEQLSGTHAPRAQADRLRIFIDHFERLIREHGGTPTVTRENLNIPGVRAQIFGGQGTSGALEFQGELQMNSLQRMDASNELLRQQLIYLQQITGLLSAIEGNDNGLQSANRQYEP